MDMHEAAGLNPADLHERFGAATMRAAQARYDRGVLAAGIAISALRNLVPTARVVYFNGPQEPNDTASIMLIQDSSGAALYSVETEIGLEELEDELSEAQDFLTGALEDNVPFQYAGIPGDYVLYLTA